TGWPDEIRNDKSTSLAYPPSYRLDKHNPQAWNLYMCQLTNHGDKDLINVRIKLHIAFHAIQNLSTATGQRNGKDCTLTFTFPHTGTNHLNWVRSDFQKSGPCSFKGFTEGKELSTQDRWAVVSSIPAHQVRIIDFVNASVYPVRFPLPDRGLA